MEDNWKKTSVVTESCNSLRGLNDFVDVAVIVIANIRPYTWCATENFNVISLLVSPKINRISFSKSLTHDSTKNIPKKILMHNFEKTASFFKNPITFFSETIWRRRTKTFTIILTKSTANLLSNTLKETKIKTIRTSTLNLTL